MPITRVPTIEQRKKFKEWLVDNPGGTYLNFLFDTRNLSEEKPLSTWELTKKSWSDLGARISKLSRLNYSKKRKEN